MRCRVLAFRSAHNPRCANPYRNIAHLLPLDNINVRPNVVADVDFFAAQEEIVTTCLNSIDVTINHVRPEQYVAGSVEIFSSICRRIFVWRH